MQAFIAETGTCPSDIRHGAGTCGTGYYNSKPGANCAAPSPRGWCVGGARESAINGQVSIVDSTLDGGGSVIRNQARTALFFTCFCDRKYDDFPRQARDKT